MHCRVDRSSREPIFRQIARYFENQIRTGKLPPGAPLPPERKLSEELGVNRSTVAAAYEELRASGLVQSVQGSGTRVSDDLWGVSPKRLPNWHEYTNGGSFLPTLPLVRRIREASADPRIISLARGQLSPDLLPAETLASLLADRSLTGSLSYPDPKGDESLRRTLSAHLKRHYGIEVDCEQILIVSGAQQALHLLTQCILRPGDAIAMEGPSYAYSLPLFISAGLRLFRIPLDEQGLKPDEVMNLYQKHKIRMVFTNPTYQNPTGTTLSLARRKRLLQICEELRLPIVEDDAYASLTLPGAPAPPPPLITLNQGGSSVIYIGSLSKTAAPGLRTGWIVGPRSVTDRLADAKQQMDFGTSVIVQKLVQLYLSSGEWEKHLRQIREQLSVRRDVMLAALQQYVREQANWTVPEGSYHVWCRLRRAIPDAELLEAGIENGVLFMPGSVFGAGPGFVRLTYAGQTGSAIIEGIKRFSETLQAIQTP
ncbi:aminotransferase-like domain-containing protein [Effusibacillus pohliae]|uniref:aminotransferase-like domain-containing protein n=1 Tax=Effusibacillus pohliae TaxID=232270 RepID=UPI0003669ABA|nr:PLP-dependent aminotransferase family protein [Effusibacillus pohliae]